MSAQGKKLAGFEAAKLVQNGMKLGLGTGSTVQFFLEGLAQRIQNEGLSVVGVPTSEATAKECARLGIKITTLDALGALDLAVDGADEIDHNFAIIKGGGGALLREKIVAHAAGDFVIIADKTKYVKTLGAFALPVEIVQFAHLTTQKRVQNVLASFSPQVMCTLRLKSSGEPFVTDEGHFIIDCAMGRIQNPAGVAAELEQIAGVVEHGLFLKIPKQLILGFDEHIEVLTSPHNMG